MQQLTKLTSACDYAYCYCQLLLLQLEQSQRVTESGVRNQGTAAGVVDAGLTTPLKFRRLRQGIEARCVYHHGQTALNLSQIKVSISHRVGWVNQ